jgi:hypothetical protein
MGVFRRNQIYTSRRVAYLQTKNMAQELGYSSKHCEYLPMLLHVYLAATTKKKNARDKHMIFKIIIYINNN